jgi:hypothetical protein
MATKNKTTKKQTALEESCGSEGGADEKDG